MPFHIVGSGRGQSLLLTAVIAAGCTYALVQCGQFFCRVSLRQTHLCIRVILLDPLADLAPSMSIAVGQTTVSEALAASTMDSSLNLLEPQALIERARVQVDAKDPVVVQLLKLRSGMPASSDREVSPHLGMETSLNAYSAKVTELLKKVIDDVNDVDARERLILLTTNVPRRASSVSKLIYPNETLSIVIIENFAFINSITAKFDPDTMEFAAHMVRFLVRLVYNLRCWEIYHLLLIVPGLEEFLTLIGFEIILAPFGPLVRPPELYLERNMQEGLQYPYPYPFYNFLFHERDGKTARDRKVKRIKIEPYPDITLVPEPVAPVSLLDDDNLADESYKSPQKVITGRRPGRPRKVQPRPLAFGSFVAAPPPEAGGPPRRKKRGRKSKAELEQIAREARAAMERGDRTVEPVVHRQLRGSQVNRQPPAQKMFIINPHGEPGQMEVFGGGAIEEVDAAILLYGSLGLDEEPEEKYGGNPRPPAVVHQCHAVDPTSQLMCNKVFIGATELMQHQLLVHGFKRKVYPCQYCAARGKGKLYTNIDSLARHLGRRHGLGDKEAQAAVDSVKGQVDSEETARPGPLEASNSSLEAEPQPDISASVQPQQLSAVPTISQMPQNMEALPPMSQFGPTQFQTNFSQQLQAKPEGTARLPQQHYRNPNLLQRNRIVEIVELPAIQDEQQSSAYLGSHPQIPPTTKMQNVGLQSHGLPQQQPAPHLSPPAGQFMPLRDMSGRPAQFIPMATLPQYAQMQPYAMMPGRPGMMMGPPPMQQYMCLPPIHVPYAMAMPMMSMTGALQRPGPPSDPQEPKK
ncbi:hypothetical protein JNB11_02750 [Kocuria palustris]|nr:hypothetical protein [Kocuria palustris]